MIVPSTWSGARFVFALDEVGVERDDGQDQVERKGDPFEPTDRGDRPGRLLDPP